MDEHLISKDDSSISVLGDCCLFPDPVLGKPIRLESVQAATDHARTIAARLTGTSAAYRAVPLFWSDQSNLKLQIAGLSTDANAWEVTQNDADGLIVLCFRDDELRAVETINAVAAHMAGPKLLASGQNIYRQDLAADKYVLRAAAKQF